MSTNANPNAAHIWLDGDAYRGEAGMNLPADPFADKVEGMIPFGGIEAGFEPSDEQTVDMKEIFNYRIGAYKISRKPLKEGIKFRAVDQSEATTLTRMMGGKIKKVGDNYVLEKGNGEEFSLLVRLDDGDESMVLFSPRVTLKAPPTRTGLDGENIDGWEFDLAALDPFVEILPVLPAGMKAEGEETADTETAGTGN